MRKRVAIIGAGPAGLMAAHALIHENIDIHVFDKMPSVGRKFLLAGIGGMNITHSEPFENFSTRYFEQSPRLLPLLKQFGPDQLRDFIHQLGIETFVGSSGRVFPKEMKAAPLLRKWLQYLKTHHVQFHVRHNVQEWRLINEKYVLEIQSADDHTQEIFDALIFACGGASWKKLGSDGLWQQSFLQKNIDVLAFKPSNCGFDIAWSDYIKHNFSGNPLKNIDFFCYDKQGHKQQTKGQAVITQHGIEGGAIYALSSYLRDQFEQEPTFLYLDLLPNKTEENIVALLNNARMKMSISNILKKTLKLDALKVALLFEYLTEEERNSSELLPKKIKTLRLPLLRTRPIDEVISSAGGLSFNELNEELMLKKFPGIFAAGEMLDWEAPTGGYLLTACFAMGWAAGESAKKWLL